MIMTWEMQQRLIQERKAAEDLAMSIIEAAQRLHISPEYLLHKITWQLGKMPGNEDLI